MKDRIRKLRKDILKMSQSDFGKELGIPRDTVANIELGRSEIKDFHIKSICNRFNVSELWIRTGEGDYFIKKTKNQEIIDFLNRLMEMPYDNLQKKFILSLSKLDESDFSVIAKIIEGLK